MRALGDSEDAVVAAAHNALVQVTLQDLGTDARLWIRWWEQNSSKHRIEWLIDALGHDVAEIRKGAAEELRALTKEYFGYAGDLPPSRPRSRAAALPRLVAHGGSQPLSPVVKSRATIPDEVRRPRTFHCVVGVSGRAGWAAAGRSCGFGRDALERP